MTDTKGAYMYSGTEEFLSGVKVKYNRSPCLPYTFTTPCPEKFAIVNLVTGSVGFLSMDKTGQDRIVQNNSGPYYGFQSVSLLTFCLKYIYDYAASKGHGPTKVDQCSLKIQP